MDKIKKYRQYFVIIFYVISLLGITVYLHFENSKDNARLMDFILDKLIELSAEIMPDNYTEILRLEKRFFELRYSEK